MAKQSPPTPPEALPPGMSATKGMTNGEIHELIKEYGFTPEDMWNDKARDLIIVSRKGILKIIFVKQLNMAKTVHVVGPDSFAVVTRVSARMGLHEAYIDATGEASKENTTFKFPLAVAEKRSESRAVLTYIGVYYKGVIGEAELDVETEQIELYNKRKNQASQAVADLKKTITP